MKRSEIPDFVLNPTEEDGDLQKEQVPIDSLYSYKATNTDAKGAAEYRATAPDGRAEDGRGSTRATRGMS